MLGKSTHCTQRDHVNRRDARLPRAGDHPVIVLTINVLIPRLSAVTVAVVTGTR
jgi:hypothetical protein